MSQSEEPYVKILLTVMGFIMFIGYLYATYLQLTDPDVQAQSWVFLLMIGLMLVFFRLVKVSSILEVFSR